MGKRRFIVLSVFGAILIFIVVITNVRETKASEPYPKHGVQRAPIDVMETMTKRELEITALLVQRLSNKEIAEKLCISPETVKRHVYNIYQKLNVSTRREAAKKATALGIL